MSERRTVVSFHAHPDDEVLLTGGTLARAAAEGHRVVLVTATAGGNGLARSRYRGDGGLATRRMRELEASAAALGVAEVLPLGYEDSGMDGNAAGSTFVRADLEEAAARLALVLQHENADVLTVYDEHGGYGHPDHVRVHDVGVRAAQLAGTPAVLEATIDRDLLRRVVRLMRVARVGSALPFPSLDQSFTPRRLLTHRVDVGEHLAAKRAAMAAHVTQASADEGDRSLAFFLRLPKPVFRLAFGHEWFVRRGAAGRGPLLDDIFASCEPAASR